MALSLNRLSIIGNVGTLPEMRFTPGGTQVATFSVATNRRWQNQQSKEWQEETQWHRVVAWTRLAEKAAQFITVKGARVYVEGRLQTRSWEGQDGTKRYSTEIVASSLIILDAKTGDHGAEGGFSPQFEGDLLPIDEQFNRVTLLGSIEAIPELRSTPAGDSLATFPIVTVRKWTAPDGSEKEEFQRFTVVAWKTLGEWCAQYFTTKGVRVFVEGRLRTRTWERDDGKHLILEVFASDVIPAAARGRTATAWKAEEGDYMPDLDPADLPF